MASFSGLESNDDDAPLALAQLRDRLSSTTLAWLLEEEESSRLKAAGEDEDEAKDANERLNLFQLQNDDDEEEEYTRVQEWTSSVSNPDGVGGYYNTRNDGVDDEKILANSSAKLVRVKYILSDAPGGHGDDIWAASRHVSNLLADPIKCRRLLTVGAQESFSSSSIDYDEPDPEQQQQQQQQPQRTRALGLDGNKEQPPHGLVLHGKRFVELGAGGGLPSWTALRCGAQVVCTDQPIADRIRVLAESAERNLRDMMMMMIAIKQGRDRNGEDGDGDNASTPPTPPPQAQVCPHSWGSPVHDVLHALDDTNNTNGPRSADDDERVFDDDDDDLRFDIVVAADCIYMPEFHEKLLLSIWRLLKRNGDGGVALLPFALHGNTADENVWSIVKKAREFFCADGTTSSGGFCVEVLEPRQLTPADWYHAGQERPRPHVANDS